MKRSLAVVLCTLVVALAACGSRAGDEASPSTTNLSGGTSGGASTTAPQDADPAQVGTMKAACGKGDGNNTVPTGEYPDDTKGVTADTIKIATITDKGGVVKVPTKGIEESAKAFVAFCNSLGGINGRKLDLTAYDSALSAHAEVTEKACKSDAFALVMTGSVLENGAQKMVDCKLVEVGAYAASPNKSLSDRFYQPLPNPFNAYNAGNCRYMAEKYPEAVKKAAIIYVNLPPAQYRAKAFTQACEALGFKVIMDAPSPVGDSNWGPTVKAMRDKGVEYLTAVGDTSGFVALLRAMDDQGYRPEVIDIGQQYYDPELSAAPQAEGTYVLTNSVPFEEAADSPALQVYLEWLEKAAPGTAPTTLGVQAFSAGLLFAQAASALGNDLTRENLLEELSTIHEWDAGGLHPTSDPGANKTGECFLYLQVKDGKFVRSYPDEGFSCDPDNAVALKGDFGQGAKQK